MKNQVNYNDMSDGDLKQRIRSTQDEIVSARRGLRTGQFKKTSEFSRLRKEVARALTVLGERARNTKESKGVKK